MCNFLSVQDATGYNYVSIKETNNAQAALMMLKSEELQITLTNNLKKAKY